MAVRPRPRNGSLEGALAQLIQNQAQFMAHLMAHQEEDRQRFARIERDLDIIKALLIKHEEMLTKLRETIAKLPEAIREKIGFKP